ncbi:MAG: acyltransferase [Deltaproteobacteria bacterium]|nr:MAG: acyltransferase [Deltaproteobacteria bacterium]
MEIKIAGVQMACREDKKDNVQKALTMGELAAEKGAQIICFQELFNTHWFPRDINEANFMLAEDLDGPTLQTMRALAKGKGVALICPFFERDGDKYFNTAVVIDREGEILGTYRKVHVPQIPLWEERAYFTPGDKGFPVFDLGLAKIGVQICWDNFFPEGTRVLALQGAQIVFAPTAAAFASQQRWLKVMAGNAIVNGLFILRVNRVGSEPKQDFYGMSFCLSPEGDLVDEPTGLQEGILLVEVALEEVSRVRKEWPLLRDRRPEVYTSLTER